MACPGRRRPDLLSKGVPAFLFLRAWKAVTPAPFHCIIPAIETPISTKEEL
jgi:hypothetical protein